MRDGRGHAVALLGGFQDDPPPPPVSLGAPFLLNPGFAPLERERIKRIDAQFAGFLEDPFESLSL